MNNEKPRLWTRNSVLIIVINFLVFMNHIMLLSTFPFYPFYIESLGGSEALAGLAATLFSLVAVLCRPVVGWMLDNGKRRTILLIGLAGMLLMPLGYEQMFVILSAANIFSVLLYILWGRNDPSSISRSLRIANDGEKNA
jgi:MFS family permease